MVREIQDGEGGPVSPSGVASEVSSVSLATTSANGSVLSGPTQRGMATIKKTETI